MEIKFKAVRVAALLGALGGASALLTIGSAAAKAGEERLHNTSFTVYGLIPADENTKGSAATRSNRTESTSTVRTASLGSQKKTGSSRTASNEPKIEDPPMPTYDGPVDATSSMAGNGGSQISN